MTSNIQDNPNENDSEEVLSPPVYKDDNGSGDDSRDSSDFLDGSEFADLSFKVKVELKTFDSDEVDTDYGVETDYGADNGQEDSTEYLKGICDELYNNPQLNVYKNCEFMCNVYGKPVAVVFNEFGRATFSEGENFAMPLNIHSVKKPFVCEQCGKSFPYRSDLVRHERVHTGERTVQVHGMWKIIFPEGPSCDTLQSAHRREILCLQGMRKVIRS